MTVVVLMMDDACSDGDDGYDMGDCHGVPVHCYFNYQQMSSTNQWRTKQVIPHSDE